MPTSLGENVTPIVVRSTQQVQKTSSRRAGLNEVKQVPEVFRLADIELGLVRPHIIMQLERD